MQYGSPYSLDFSLDINDSISYMDVLVTRGSILIKFTPAFGKSGNFLPIVDGQKYPPVFGADDRVNVCKCRGNPRFNNHIVTLVPIGLNTDSQIEVLPYQQAFEDLHPSKLNINFTGTPRYFSLLDDNQFSNWNVTGIQRFSNSRPYQNQPTYGVLDLTITTMTPSSSTGAGLLRQSKNVYGSTLTFDYPVQAGNAIFACVSGNSATDVIDVSDDQGNVWTKAVSLADPIAGGTNLAIFSAIANGNNTPTITINGISDPGGSIYEYYYLTEVVDASNTTVVSSATSIPEGDPLTTFTSTVILAMCAQEATTGVFNPCTNGFTLLNNNGGHIDGVGSLESASPGTYACGFSFSGIEQWAVVQAAFRIASITGGTIPDISTHLITLSLNDYIIAQGLIVGSGEVVLTQVNNSGVSGTVDLAYNRDLIPADGSLFVTQFPDDYTIYLQDHPFNESNPGGTGSGGSDLTAIDDLTPIAIIRDNGHDQSYQYRTEDIMGGTYYALVRERFNCVESLNNIPAVIAIDVTPNPPGRPTLIFSSDTSGAVQFISFDASTTPDVSYNLYDSVNTGAIPNSPSYTIPAVGPTESIININVNDLASVGTDFSGYRYILVRAVSPLTGTGLTATEGGAGGIEDGNMNTLAIQYSESQILSPVPSAPAVISAVACGMDLTVNFYQSMQTIRLDTPIINSQATQVALFIYPEAEQPDYSSPVAIVDLSDNVGTTINGSISGSPLIGGSGNYKYAIRSIAVSDITGDSGVQSENFDTFGPILLTTAASPSPSFDVEISG